MAITRRRLITISAAMALLPAVARAGRGTIRQWTGQALGARASIRLDHPAGEAIAARAKGRDRPAGGHPQPLPPESALSRLNRDGHLDAPPFELLECLSLAGAVSCKRRTVRSDRAAALGALGRGRQVNGRRPDAGAVEERAGGPAGTRCASTRRP